MVVIVMMEVSKMKVGETRENLKTGYLVYAGSEGQDELLIRVQVETVMVVEMELGEVGEKLKAG